MIRPTRSVAVLVLVLVLALLAVVLQPAPQRSVADPGVRVTTTGAGSGSDASALLRRTTSRHAVWRSSGAGGATITTWFSTPTSVNGTKIRAAARSLRVDEARLEFSDGSALAVNTDRRGDRIVSFTPRTVRWVRFVVSPSAFAQKVVGLSGWTLRQGRASHVLSGKTVRSRVSVTASSGSTRGTHWSAASRADGQWLQLHWARPAEVSAVRIAGGAASADTSIRAGLLRFSDGSSIIVRTLEPKGGTPTTIAFTPRITTSVRFVATSVKGSGLAAVQSLRAYSVGEVPSEPPASTPTYKRAWTKAASCAGVEAGAPTANLRLLCPTNGTQTTHTLRLVLSGPAGVQLSVRGWRPKGTGGSLITVATGTVQQNGTARIDVPTRHLLHGPAAVRITATGLATPLYVQFVNTSGVTQQTVTSKVARGMDLKFDDDFSGRLSATRTGAGATYASGKPNYYGVDDFGEAIFAQPDGTAATSSTMPGGYLRIPARALPSTAKDPAGYGRTSTGGLLSSGHAGGSGFSVQYGYFEARMLGPAGAGTWPAFWLLSSGSLVGGGSTAEVDATELYGNDTRVAFQTTHSWLSAMHAGDKSVASSIPGGGDWALSWHTYGARVTPTGVDLYVDGVRTGHAPPVVHGDEPFFFLVDLALTGSWRTGLAPTEERADLYVDRIRVWV